MEAEICTEFAREVPLLPPEQNTVRFAQSFVHFSPGQFPTLARMCREYKGLQASIAATEASNAAREAAVKLERARLRYMEAETTERKAYLQKELNRTAYDPPSARMPLGGVGYQDASEHFEQAQAKYE
jgi:hypothetical protein